MTETRPSGITIIAILMIIGGVILLFTGLAPLFLGSLMSLDSNTQTSTIGFVITIIGLILVTLGIASSVVSWGLLKGKGWARVITLIISIIAILFAIISFANIGDLIQLIPIIIYGIIIYYMFTYRVKSFFERVTK